MENAPANLASDTSVNTPAETGGADSTPKPAGSGLFKSGSKAEAVFSNFNQLDVLRQMALLIGFAASIALGFAIVLWSQADSYRPLMSSLNEVDAAAIIEVLENERITYRIDTNSGVLLVREDQIHQARMKIASADIHQPNTVGYELLEAEQGLGTSQFMENARYLRSVEGELSRTISSLDSVRHARVHLAVPRQSVFLRDQRQPSASVVLSLAHGKSLTPEQAQSIISLVASSVPQMQVKNVTLVDQKANLLSKGEEDDVHAQADKALARQLEHTRKLEDGINRRLQTVLEPIVGANRFKAAVSLDVDFTKSEQSSEQFNPDMPAIRSEQTVNEERTGDFGPMGIPGALSNQPPQDGFAPEEAGGTDEGTRSSNRRAQATRNFELDRTLSYSQRDIGRIERLSIAVVVDDLIKANPETGAAERHPWADQDVERLTALVRNAVGYSASRGDSVTVINSPFVIDPEDELPPIPWFEQPWVWTLAKQVLAGLFVLVLIFGVLRPMLRSLAARSAEDQYDDADALVPLDGLLDDQVSLSASDDPLLAATSETYERQLNAIRALIAENPGRVAQVVRQWVNDDD